MRPPARCREGCIEPSLAPHPVHVPLSPHLLCFPQNDSLIISSFTLKTETSIQGIPGGPVVKSPPCNVGDTGSISGLGRSHMPPGN